MNSHEDDWKAVRSRYEEMLKYAEPEMKKCLEYRIERINELLGIETQNVTWNSSTSPCIIGSGSNFTVIPWTNQTTSTSYNPYTEIDEIV